MSSVRAMDTDFLDLLEQAFLDQQIDGATMDLAYMLMLFTHGPCPYFLGEYGEEPVSAFSVH